MRVLTAEVATLELLLRTLQESHEAREAKRRKRRGILARLRELETELAAAKLELAWSAGGGGAARRAGGKLPIPPDGALRVNEMRENLQEIDKYELGIKKKGQSLNRENPNGMLITPEMGGKIVFCVL